MITSADLMSLSRATLRLYSPELRLGNFTEHAYEFLAALVPCDLINFGDLDPVSGTLEATSNHQSPDWARAVEGFGRCMAQYPLFAFDPSVNGGRPFFRNDFYTAREFRNLDMYAECFRILGVNNHAAVHVAGDDGNIRYFALERAGRKDYTERDRILLEHSQHHLANARRLAIVRQRMQPATELDPAGFACLGLTARECEVAFWLTQGKSNDEIARILTVSLQTIKAHITVLFNKTGTSNRLALTLQLMEGAQQPRISHHWHRTQLFR
jgi:DNA-binding CsgD family transcriptional regulator